jgi:glucose-1-phosphate cytidylyltransferase
LVVVPMKTVILAGGLGSRLAEETTVRPKPMVEIGGWPILWHIMNVYAAQGFKDFVVACGYKGHLIKEYFCDLQRYHSDLTVDLKTGGILTQGSRSPDWRVSLVDTGYATATGGRLKRLAPWLSGETFLMTYGDGVGNIDLRALLEQHRSSRRLLTITAVHPPARFGELIFEGSQVIRFSEKPQSGAGWINGGFMALEPAVLDYIDGDETVFERGPLERLAAEGQLGAYRHHGFWQPMDTLREKQLLEELWHSGQAPWKVWND